MVIVANRAVATTSKQTSLPIVGTLIYPPPMKLLQLAFLLTMAIAPATAQAQNICGASINDWCISAKSDACGRHMDEASCRADTKCAAVRYSGESVVACHWDARGFADNCPAVGCQDK
jgi:hypothetical protein